MALFKVQPTAVDVAIANQIASRTGRRSEHAAEALTWGADEHVLCALAAAWWLYSRYRDRATRRAGDHILFTTLTASALPHCLKKIFDQERPDRMTVKGHFHGIPPSGNRLDAFPSGHALHIVSLASAATVLPPNQRTVIWALGAALVSTRTIPTTHFARSLPAGPAASALLSRLLSPPPRSSSVP